MNTYREARAAWLMLEQLATQVPRADQTCRQCGATTPTALCESCERERIDGLRRFGGRAGSNASPRTFHPTRSAETQTKTRPKASRLPYDDDQTDHGSKMPLRILSLGAGIQSTTLALMASHGELDPVDCAIFADTQSEPKAVYDHLAKLMAPGVLPFPVYIVSKGSLRQELIDASEGKRGAWGRPPLFLRNPDGSGGMTRRQCTQDYKLDVITRKVRELAGIKRGSRGPKEVVVEQLIGISIDEAHRQKDARFRWIENIYPLVRHMITRTECIEKLTAWGWPSVPKSACTFCPYHNDAMWQEMKTSDPVSFADAVNVDRLLREPGLHFHLRGEAYLHASRQPLEFVEFDKLIARRAAKREPPQPNLFGNECEGMCGN